MTGRRAPSAAEPSACFGSVLVISVLDRTGSSFAIARDEALEGFQAPEQPPAVDKPSLILQSFASDSATNLHFDNGIPSPRRCWGADSACGRGQRGAVVIE